MTTFGANAYMPLGSGNGVDGFASDSLTSLAPTLHPNQNPRRLQERLPKAFQLKQSTTAAIESGNDSTAWPTMLCTRIRGHRILGRQVI